MKKLYPEITDKEELFQAAGKDCIREFLFRELDMLKRVIRDMRIKNIFYPPHYASGYNKNGKSCKTVIYP